MRILLITPSLGFGGAERVLTLLTKSLLDKGHQVTLMVLNGANDSAYEVENVKIWNYKRVSRAIPALFFFLLRNRFDVVFASARNLNYYLAIFRKLGIIRRLVIRDNSISSVMSKYVPERQKKFMQILAPSYGWADRIICQSQDMLNDIHASIDIPSRKLVLINNPANPNIKPVFGSRCKGKLITVARLSQEKGFDRLLTLLKNLQGDWEFNIYGDGPLKRELEDRVLQLGLEQRVFFKGTTHNVDLVLNEADIFITGSYVEGFPNSVLEAILCGVPAVAFNCLGGMKEIIDHGVNGFLVETPEEFIEALNESLSRDWPRNEISAKAATKFGYERIMQKYEDVFIGVVNA